MKAKVSRTEYVEVDISEYEISQLIRKGNYTDINAMLWGVRQSLADKCTGNREAYVKGKKWVWDEEHHTSHSWSTTEELSEATKDEIAMWSTLDKLQEMVRPYG